VILIDSSLWIDALIDPVRVPDASNRIAEFVTCGHPSKVPKGWTLVNRSLALQRLLLALPRISDPVPEICI